MLYKRTLAGIAQAQLTISRYMELFRSLVATAGSTASVSRLVDYLKTLAASAGSTAGLGTLFMGAIALYYQTMDAIMAGVATINTAWIQPITLAAVASVVSSMTATFIAGMLHIISTAGEVIDVLLDNTTWLIDTIGSVYRKVVSKLYEKL
jgi:hypothetical protein